MDLPPLTRGTLLRRYKRFLADVELEDGSVVIAHCPNPGRMTSCQGAGWPVWLTHHDNPKRKLKWTWELTRNPDDAWILVNTARPNAIAKEGIESGRIAELATYETLRTEVKYGDSRIDLMLDDTLVEVKSVTLRHADREARFPDAVTKRGTKHLGELVRAHEEGRRAVLLFLLGRDDCDSVRPADSVDLAYGNALRAAHAAGVEVLAYRLDIDDTYITVGDRVPVHLT
ncbi:MAG: DNA/RNA nuclease SfsA [Proteobacteria bacterium]|nr:DNA/RNA nuclease SfsA [Pseudomonadota bacterium]